MIVALLYKDMLEKGLYVFIICSEPLTHRVSFPHQQNTKEALKIGFFTPGTLEQRSTAIAPAGHPRGYRALFPYGTGGSMLFYIHCLMVYCPEETGEIPIRRINNHHIGWNTRSMTSPAARGANDQGERGDG
ncbi:MAG: hypothetical protein WC993_04515 [Methanoculleus sp.]